MGKTLMCAFVCPLQTGDLADIEAVSDHLRAAHKEYQRRQRSVFIKQVERALGVARQRNDTLDSEAQLQVPCQFSASFPVQLAKLLQHAFCMRPTEDVICLGSYQQELEHRHLHKGQHSRNQDEPSPLTSTNHGSGDSDNSSGADMDIKVGQLIMCTLSIPSQSLFNCFYTRNFTWEA